jgi:hypothetical protein
VVYYGPGQADPGLTGPPARRHSPPCRPTRADAVVGSLGGTLLGKKGSPKPPPKNSRKGLGAEPRRQGRGRPRQDPQKFLSRTPGGHAFSAETVPPHTPLPKTFQRGSARHRAVLHSAIGNRKSAIPSPPPKDPREGFAATPPRPKLWGTLSRAHLRSAAEPPPQSAIARSATHREPRRTVGNSLASHRKKIVRKTLTYLDISASTCLILARQGELRGVGRAEAPARAGRGRQEAGSAPRLQVDMLCIGCPTVLDGRPSGEMW